MIPTRGDRILFLNSKERVRAGCVEDFVEEADGVVLFVSTEAGIQIVPLERLQALVTLQTESRSLFGDY